MTLLESLRSEHALIERVIGSLRTFVLARGTRSTATPATDGAAFVRFFRRYAGHYHHAREEDNLIRALVDQAEVPADHGPLAVILDAHGAIAAVMDEMAPLLDDEASDATRLMALAARHGKALLHHIDAENSVLFPEADKRLRAASVPPLANRAPNEAEEAARLDGERLVASYPPSEYTDSIRGDGCVACPDYGHGCDGIEREWWTELEWEDFFDRNGSGGD